MRNLAKDLDDFGNARDLTDAVKLATEVLPEAIGRALAAEAEVKRLNEALTEDGSGQPVTALLSEVADYLRGAGGGPLEDRVRYVLGEISAALKAGDPA